MSPIEPLQLSGAYFTDPIREYNNRGLHLSYHIFSGLIDAVVYELEITILDSEEKVSLPCYLLPEDNPKPKILRTLGILNEFVKITQNT